MKCRHEFVTRLRIEHAKKLLLAANRLVNNEWNSGKELADDLQ
jgi:hypothetical protein